MWTCQGVTTFTKFRAWSANFGQNGGWIESRGAQIFLCGNPDNLFATSQWQIWPRNVSRESGDSFKNFHFRGHLPQKSEIENRSNRHLTQSRLQVTWCTAERYCLPRVIVQGPGSSRLCVFRLCVIASCRPYCPILNLQHFGSSYKAHQQSFSAFYWASKLRKYAVKQQNVNFESLYNIPSSGVKIVKKALRQSLFFTKLWGVEVAQFSVFGPFSPYKTPKT